MRKDMSKVIVERPRTGDGWDRKGRTVALNDGDDGPLRQRTAPKKRQRTKHLNENLAPLRRYLESNIGRPWNKVHAEIAENIRITNAVQKHVLEHVEDYVATRTMMKDGKVHVTQGRFRGGPTPVDESWTLLYVHPKTGKLMRNRRYREALPSRQQKAVRVEDRRRELGPLRQAHRFADGAWWDVVLEAVPTRTEKLGSPTRTAVKRKVDLPFEDVVHARKLSQLPAAQLYGRSRVYAVSARRLTKAERKKLDLP